jgi:serine protease AprX
VSGVPAGTTATFTPSTIVGGSGSSTLTVKPSPSTPPGTYELIVTGTSGTLSHSDGVPLIVSP